MVARVAEADGLGIVGEVQHVAEPPRRADQPVDRPVEGRLGDLQLQNDARVGARPLDCVARERRERTRRLGKRAGEWRSRRRREATARACPSASQRQASRRREGQHAVEPPRLVLAGEPDEAARYSRSSVRSHVEWWKTSPSGRLATNSSQRGSAASRSTTRRPTAASASDGADIGQSVTTAFGLCHCASGHGYTRGLQVWIDIENRRRFATSSRARGSSRPPALTSS